MPIQVSRARANLMTSKDLNKVQSEVKKASEKTLTGAVKAWCQLFKSGKVCALSYYSDIGRKGFFVPNFTK